MLVSFGDGGNCFDLTVILNNLTASLLSCNATLQSFQVPGSPEAQQEFSSSTVSMYYMQSMKNLFLLACQKSESNARNFILFLTQVWSILFQTQYPNVCYLIKIISKNILHNIFVCLLYIILCISYIFTKMKWQYIGFINYFFTQNIFMKYLPHYF